MIECPRCGEVFDEDAHIVGRWGVKCPRCGKIFENSLVKPALRWAGLWHPGPWPGQEKCDTLADAMYGIAGMEHKPSSKKRPLSLEEYQRLEAEEDAFTEHWSRKE
jgi:hypothetical protein